MNIKSFDEWFAIRANHDDSDHWTARLYFDPNDGIRLKTVRFKTTTGESINSTIANNTMTGWLDFQSPTTLINPWIQSIGGFSASLNHVAMREKYTIAADAILKNVFLSNLSDPIFTGIVVDHPAVHAWIQPNLVHYEWSDSDRSAPPSLSVNVKPAQERSFRLASGIQVTVYSGSRTPSDSSSSLEDYTTLRIQLPDPACYDDIMRLIWRVSTLFDFMIGERTAEPLFQLTTTHTRRWNDEDHIVTAELHCPSAHKAVAGEPDHFSTLTAERRSSVSLAQLAHLFEGNNDDLLYLANLIQSADSHELPFVQIFGELLGCLENFDSQNFGSGADPEFKSVIAKLEKTVKAHASDDELRLFERMRGGAKNSFSLLKRLERLHSAWQSDGFRGNPSLKRIRDLRNLLPHGQGLQLTSDIAQEILEYLTYLKTLGRYHVLKRIGYDGPEIARSLSRKPHRFGMFVPARPQPQKHPSNI